LDHRQSIGPLRVPSVIHALESVGETTTAGVVVFLLRNYITLEMVA
jgi:hypothetical protein